MRKRKEHRNDFLRFLLLFFSYQNLTSAVFAFEDNKQLRKKTKDRRTKEI
jgi:hypothetical protein